MNFDSDAKDTSSLKGDSQSLKLSKKMTITPGTTSNQVKSSLGHFIDNYN